MTHLLLDTAANFESEVQFPSHIFGTHALSCYFSVNTLTSMAYIITWKCRKTNDKILLLLAKDALAILWKEEPSDVFTMFSLSDKIVRGLFGLGHQNQKQCFLLPTFQELYRRWSLILAYRECTHQVLLVKPTYLDEIQ